MSTPTYATEAARLRAALEYAIRVIESYQMDIRTVASEGFCQGSIYLDAVDMIRRIAEGKLTV